MNVNIFKLEVIVIILGRKGELGEKECKIYDDKIFEFENLFKII